MMAALEVSPSLTSALCFLGSLTPTDKSDLRERLFLEEFKSESVDIVIAFDDKIKIEYFIK